jgi:nitrogen regulatory protein PII
MKLITAVIRAERLNEVIEALMNHRMHGLVVPDDDADALAEVVAKHARTGVIGDGKLWVSEVSSVLRVRTGDRDLAAL